MPPRLLLASRSPRRAELLRAAGIPFDRGEPPDVDETPPPGLEREPAEVARTLAERKALHASARAPDRVVLAADTVVAVDGELLGKPGSPAEAERMLERLSGRTHRVATGVAVAAHGRLVSGVEVADVTFRRLAPEEVRRYVATGEPLDKAGAYAVQGGAAAFVERLAGAVDTVVGLPIALVRRLLAAAEAPAGRPEGR